MLPPALLHAIIRKAFANQHGLSSSWLHLVAILSTVPAVSKPMNKGATSKSKISCSLGEP
eukprot:12082291-Karenia_brevis.AAC.1